MLPLQKLLRHEAGSVLITLALCLFVLCAFLALAVEAGRWYLVRAELSKSVDAGALMGAKNISNPHVDPEEIAEEVSQANFDTGFLRTQDGGQGTLEFDARLVDGSKVIVESRTDALGIVSRLWGVERLAVRALGAAAMREVELMLVLDRSGSMNSGNAIADLKIASKSFIDHFQDTEDRDNVGLVSFATSVRVDRALGTHFVSPMKTAIDAMVANGATNMEDALDQADGPQGFTDQSSVLPDRRVSQFLVFFSDGRPTAFRGTFRHNGADLDGVGCVDGNCVPGDGTQGVWRQLGRPGVESWFPSAIQPNVTGDGEPAGSSACEAGSVRWYTFDSYPVPGYSPAECGIPAGRWGPMHDQICGLASYFTLEHAQELKDSGITIYAIGLGDANPEFLAQLATSPEHSFYAPTSDQLEALFQKVAKRIKLRLVS